MPENLGPLLPAICRAVLCLALCSIPALASTDEQDQDVRRIFVLSYADEYINPPNSVVLGIPRNFGRVTQFAQISGCSAVLKKVRYVADGPYDAEVTAFDLPVVEVAAPRQSRYSDTDWVAVFRFDNPAMRRTVQRFTSPDWREEWQQPVGSMEVLEFDFSSIGFAIKNDDGGRAAAFVAAFRRYQDKYCRPSG